jgi:hypothetical protein
MSTGELELLHVSHEECIQTGSGAHDVGMPRLTSPYNIQTREQQSLDTSKHAETRPLRVVPDHLKGRTNHKSVTARFKQLQYYCLLRPDQKHNLNLNFNFNLDPTQPNLPNRTKIKPTLDYSQRKPACISSSPSPACSSPSPTPVP